MSAPFRMSAISCGATAVAMAAIAIGAMGPGPRIERSFIERSYAQAFERMDEAQVTAMGRSASRLDPAHIHLSRLPAVEPASPALAIGDRITLSARDGGAVSYEVIEVRALTGGITGTSPQAGLDAPSARLMLVTAVSPQPGTKAKTVRFIVDADAPAASALPGLDTGAKPHAL